jgi:hypothetical protein
MLFGQVPEAYLDFFTFMVHWPTKGSAAHAKLEIPNMAAINT